MFHLHRWKLYDITRWSMVHTYKGVKYATNYYPVLNLECTKCGKLKDKHREDLSYSDKTLVRLREQYGG